MYRMYFTVLWKTENPTPSPLIPSPPPSSIDVIFRKDKYQKQVFRPFNCEADEQFPKPLRYANNYYGYSHSFWYEKKSQL